MKDQFFQPTANLTDLSVNRIRIINPRAIRMYRVFEDVATPEEKVKKVEKLRPICKNFSDGKIEEDEVAGKFVQRNDDGSIKQKVCYAFIVYHFASNRLKIYSIEQKTVITRINEISTLCASKMKTIADLDISIRKKGSTQLDTEYSIEIDQIKGEPIFETLEQRILDFYELCKNQRLITGSKLFSGGYPIEGIALEEVPKTVYRLTEGQSVTVHDFYNAVLDEDIDKASVMLKYLQQSVNVETMLLEYADENGEVLTIPFHQLKNQLEELRCAF